MKDSYTTCEHKDKDSPKSQGGPMGDKVENTGNHNQTLTASLILLGSN